MTYRRQRYQYIFAGLLAVIVVVNVLFYFILTRPSQSEYADLQKSIEQTQKQVSSSQEFFANLETSSAALGKFDQDKDRLLMIHAVQRSKGYSEILDKLDGIVKKANVKKSSVTYTRFPTPMPGLESVSISLPVEGNYTNVVNFIRELENSDTFFLITAINVERSSQATGLPGAAGQGAGSVALALTLETYFYQ